MHPIQSHDELIRQNIDHALKAKEAIRIAQETHEKNEKDKQKK